MTKKHLTLPGKILLFVCFSMLYILPFLLAVITEEAVINICVKHNINYLHGNGATFSLILSYGIMLVGVLLLIFAEAVLYRKADISDSFFVPSVLASTVLFVICVFLRKAFTGRFSDGEMLLLYFAVLGIIKAVYDIARLIRIKKYSLIPVCLLCLTGTLICFFTPYLYEEYRLYTESVNAAPFLMLSGQ